MHRCVASVEERVSIRETFCLNRTSGTLDGRSGKGRDGGLFLGMLSLSSLYVPSGGDESGVPIEDAAGAALLAGQGKVREIDRQARSAERERCTRTSGSRRARPCSGPTPWESSCQTSETWSLAFPSPTYGSKETQPLVICISIAVYERTSFPTFSCSDPLVLTGNSNTPKTAFRRYLDTTYYLCKWQVLIKVKGISVFFF